MKLITFTESSRTRIGLLQGEQVVDLSQVAPTLPHDMLTLLQSGATAMTEAAKHQQGPTHFAVADVVFLGGSLLPIGGHNPLEPAQFGLPVISGPHLAKNQAEFAGIREIGGVTDITSGDELADAVRAGILTGKAKQARESAMKSYVEGAGKRPAIAADYILKLLHDRTRSQ